MELSEFYSEIRTSKEEIVRLENHVRSLKKQAVSLFSPLKNSDVITFDGVDYVVLGVDIKHCCVHDDVVFSFQIAEKRKNGGFYQSRIRKVELCLLNKVGYTKLT
jgi:hypothetical protein